MSKRELKGSSEAYPRKFFDRKVMRHGFSQVLAITKVIPDDWAYVRIWPEYAGEDEVVLRLECLMRSDNVPPLSRTRKKRKQES